MQLWIMLAALVVDASEARHFYPYTNPSSTYFQRDVTTNQPLPQDVNDVTVVDQRTGIHYNPYSKHHPGRHVCTKHVPCKPTYKKYTVRCGSQWCEGVRLVYEKYHKEHVSDANHTHLDYLCCPGWTQVNYRSHGCNRPHCSQPCLNGGKCIKPNYCSCPPGYDGTYCETKTSLYATSKCVPPCANGGLCKAPTVCICPPGYTGSRCEADVNECKTLKPCDQICYNVPGSFKCECKENFLLQSDGQTCRKEYDEGTTLEAKDLEGRKVDVLDRRLLRLEQLVRERTNNEVSKKDLTVIYGNIDKISNDISIIANKLQRLEGSQNGRSRSQSVDRQNVDRLSVASTNKRKSLKSNSENEKNITRCGPTNCPFQR